MSDIQERAKLYIYNDSRTIDYMGDIDEYHSADLINAIKNWTLDDDKQDDEKKNFERKPITLVISSHGGTVDAMWAIIDTILSSKTDINTYCPSYAYSAGAMIFLAGKHRDMGKFAKIMIHNESSWGIGGQTQDIKELTDELQKDQDDIIRYITSRTKIDEATLEEAFLAKRDTYYRYDECVENGIVTEHSI